LNFSQRFKIVRIRWNSASILVVSMQSENPLTPTLSPSDGEREKIAVSFEDSLNSELAASDSMYSLAPSDGERVRVRGASN
jgi:hypothetical protein